MLELQQIMSQMIVVFGILVRHTPDSYCKSCSLFKNNPNTDLKPSPKAVEWWTLMYANLLQDANVICGMLMHKPPTITLNGYHGHIYYKAVQKRFVHVKMGCICKNGDSLSFCMHFGHL